MPSSQPACTGAVPGPSGGEQTAASVVPLPPSNHPHSREGRDAGMRLGARGRSGGAAAADGGKRNGFGDLTARCLACSGHQLTHSQPPSSLQASMHALAVGALAVRTLLPPNQTESVTISVSCPFDTG